MNDLYEVIANVHEANVKATYTTCDGCQSGEHLSYSLKQYIKNTITIRVWCSTCKLVVNHDLKYQLNRSTNTNILPKSMKLYPKFESCLRCSSHRVVNMAKLDGSECLNCGFSSLIDPDNAKQYNEVIGFTHRIKRTLCPQCELHSLSKNVYYDSDAVKLECYQCKFCFIYDLEPH